MDGLQDKAVVRRSYRHLAAVYDVVYPLFSGSKRVRERYFDDAPFDRDDHVLDVGCGTGLSTVESLARAGRVDGVDISPHQLRRARRKGIDARFVVGDADRLPFRDDVFDGVVSIGALPYLPDPTATFAEARRVTRPDGSVLAAGAKRPAGRLRAAIAERAMLVTGAAETRRIFEAAGWREVDVRTVHMDYLLRDAVVVTGRA